MMTAQQHWMTPGTQYCSASGFSGIRFLFSSEYKLQYWHQLMQITEGTVLGSTSSRISLAHYVIGMVSVSFFQIKTVPPGGRGLEARDSGSQWSLQDPLLIHTASPSHITKAGSCCWGGGFAGELPASRAGKQECSLYQSSAFWGSPFPRCGHLWNTHLPKSNPNKFISPPTMLGQEDFLGLSSVPYLGWLASCLRSCHPRKGHPAGIKVYLRALYTAAR